jgi:hypothetical protein
MLTHPQAPAGFFLRKTCHWTRLAKVCFPFAFSKPPFREKRKEGWGRSGRETQPKMWGRERLRRGKALLDPWQPQEKVVLAWGAAWQPPE